MAVDLGSLGGIVSTGVPSVLASLPKAAADAAAAVATKAGQSAVVKALAGALGLAGTAVAAGGLTPAKPATAPADTNTPTPGLLMLLAVGAILFN